MGALLVSAPKVSVIGSSCRLLNAKVYLHFLGQLTGNVQQHMEKGAPQCNHTASVKESQNIALVWLKLKRTGLLLIGLTNPDNAINSNPGLAKLFT